MTASVSGRYASALFDLARDQNVVAAVEADLATFATMLGLSDDLRALVRSPVISTVDQGRAVAAVLAKAGIGGIASHFIQLVTRNRRLFVIGDIIRDFRAIAANARGEVTAEVTSAMPLTEAQTAALAETLKAQAIKSKAGKSVVVVTKVDPSLLGGLIVKIGSRMIDSSLKTKLASLSFALKAGA